MAAGNTVIVVEHDMSVVARSDWVIDVGPGAGEEGGKIVAFGTPAELARNANSPTAPFLKKFDCPAACGRRLECLRDYETSLAPHRLVESIHNMIRAKVVTTQIHC